MNKVDVLEESMVLDGEVVDTTDANWETVNECHSGVVLAIGTISLEVSEGLSNKDAVSYVSSIEELNESAALIARLVKALKSTVDETYAEHKGKVGDFKDMEELTIATKCMVTYQTLLEDIPVTLIPPVTNVLTLLEDGYRKHLASEAKGKQDADETKADKED